MKITAVDVMDKINDPSMDNVTETENKSDDKEISSSDVEAATALLAEGKRHFLCGNAAEAAQALSEACHEFSRLYGETALECADAYYYYGRTLLELARKEPDVIANAVEGVPLDDTDNDGDDGSCNPEEFGETSGTNGTATESKSTDEENIRQQILDAFDEIEQSADKAKESDTTDDKKTAKDQDESQSESGSDNDGDDEEVNDDDDVEEASSEEIPEEISNLQLSWEMLELARVILEKYSDDASRKRLADCRLALGEQAVEDQQYERAVEEYHKYIDLQSFKDHRNISSAHFQIGLAYSLYEKYDLASEAFQEAIRYMKMRQASLEKLIETSDNSDKSKFQEEVSELDSLIADVQQRVQDCIESCTEREASKTALQQLNSKKTKDDDDASTSGCSSSNIVAKDIAHLVRRPLKRSSNEPETEESDVKRQKVTEENA